MNSEDRRCTSGVGFLSDIKPKRIEDAPIILPSPPRMRKSKTTITISTDGSTVGRVIKSEGLSQVGAWAYKYHIGEKEHCGVELKTTTNRMELRAVIEALKSSPLGSSVFICTDTRYVVNAIHWKLKPRSYWEYLRLARMSATGQAETCYLYSCCTLMNVNSGLFSMNLYYSESKYRERQHCNQYVTLFFNRLLVSTVFCCLEYSSI